MAKLPPVLGVDDLPLAELCAARIDGDLFAFGDAFIAIDEPDLPQSRALVVAHSAPRALIVERLSAAWVHGAAITPPRPAQFCVPIGARISVIADPSLVVREVRISDGEIVSIGGVACTSPVRTALDLLRDPKTEGGIVVDAVAALLREHAGLEGRVRDRIAAAHRLPHKALALARLGDAIARRQPSLTRYTS